MWTMWSPCVTGGSCSGRYIKSARLGRSAAWSLVGRGRYLCMAGERADASAGEASRLAGGAMQGGAGSSWQACSKGMPCQLFLAQELRRGIRRGMHESLLSMQQMDGLPACEVPAGGENGGAGGAVHRPREIAQSLRLAASLSRSPSPSASEVEMRSHVTSLVRPSEISGSSVILDTQIDEAPLRRRPITLTLGVGRAARDAMAAVGDGLAGDPGPLAQGCVTPQSDEEHVGREGHERLQLWSAVPMPSSHLWLEAQLLPQLPSSAAALRAAVNACVRARRVLVAWHVHSAANAGRLLARWAHLCVRAHLQRAQGCTSEASVLKMFQRWEHMRLRCACARWNTNVARRRKGARALRKMRTRSERNRLRSVFLCWCLDVSRKRHMLSRARAFSSRALRGVLCFVWDCLVAATPRERMRHVQIYADCHQLPLQLPQLSIYLQGAAQAHDRDAKQTRAHMRVHQRATQTSLMAWDPLAATIRCFETRGILFITFLSDFSLGLLVD